ncbi:hypothetical protein AKO1_013602 [Acrasis kona]|uniref:Uncharacterized protein n=1 Tax=Acrasis kona TaxID=1008807 RepID=A0AAW2YV72_9EUKA
MQHTPSNTQPQTFYLIEESMEELLLEGLDREQRNLEIQRVKLDISNITHVHEQTIESPAKGDLTNIELEIATDVTSKTQIALNPTLETELENNIFDSNSWEFVDGVNTKTHKNRWNFHGSKKRKRDEWSKFKKN